MSAQPIFIVSSGRAGSAMMDKALSTYPQIEMHHEYCCTHVQPVAVRKYMGLADSVDVHTMLREIYEPALNLSSAPLWGDSSNKLSWIIPELAEHFENAKFIHVVRDGRKVASSYLHKLGGECYDDFAAKALAAHVADAKHVPAPPPEKRYWWPQPPKGHPLHSEFANFDQFQRIAFHWAEITRVILAAFADLPMHKTHTVRLEDLCTDPGAIQNLTEFLSLPPRNDLFELFQRPHNVNQPKDTALTPRQAEEFGALAHHMMEHFGYSGTEEYRVAY